MALPLGEAGIKQIDNEQPLLSSMQTTLKAPGFYMIITNQPGDGSWPISASTFILMPKKVKDAAAAAEALKFFAWSYDKGDDMAKSLDYVPMPASVKDLVKKTWADIKTDDGKPVM